MTRWWFPELVVFLMSAGCIGLAALMVPSDAVVSILGWDVPEICMWGRVFNLACPGCGLTRSFAYMADAQLSSAFRLNLFGPPLFALIAAQVPYRAYVVLARGPRVRRK